ncbi:hypothetical protein C900_00357 [Fulvivirga imtechensis AK7]|uniref:Uncharacterized protein n=1 Tax=Fulvivirga imtechensis AK7 TaxID=1237149 RepID=L8JLR5_9BACT|nr:hypothetical protein C900_00357 [Fulvivirga imtechensis AK7]
MIKVGFDEQNIINTNAVLCYTGVSFYKYEIISPLMDNQWTYGGFST